MLLSDKFDLVDTNGELKNLTDHMTEYAYNFVDPRETYVLIQIEGWYKFELKYRW